MVQEVGSRKRLPSESAHEMNGNVAKKLLTDRSVKRCRVLHEGCINCI